MADFSAIFRFYSIPISLILGVFLQNPVSGSSILVLASDPSNSHILFWNRILQVLHSKNHSVSVWTLRIQNEGGPEHKLPQNTSAFQTRYDFGSFFTRFQENLFTTTDQDTSVATMFENFDLLQSACLKQLNDFEIIDQLGTRSFDLVLTGTPDLCPKILSKILGIDRMIVLSVEPLFDHVSILMNLNRLPSYIPHICSASSDRMGGLMERMTSFLAQIVQEAVVHLWFSHWAKQRRLYDEYFSQDLYQDYRSSSVLINGPSIIDFPRPFSHNQQYLGLIDVDVNSPNILDPTWIDLINNSNKSGIILMVFGTNVNPDRIPMEISKSLLNAVSPLVNYLVIWRFKRTIFTADTIPSHVRIVEWLPQRALLAHPQTRLLVTHGGCQGLNEAIQAGVPLVQVPLFVDHSAHAQRALRLGISIVVHKHELLQGRLRSAIQEALHDKSLKNRMSCVSSMFSDTLQTESSTLQTAIKRSQRKWKEETGTQTVNDFTYFQIEYFLLILIISIVCY